MEWVVDDWSEYEVFDKDDLDEDDYSDDSDNEFDEDCHYDSDQCDCFEDVVKSMTRFHQLSHPYWVVYLYF